MNADLKQAEYSMMVQQFQELQMALSQMQKHIEELGAIKDALNEIGEVPEGKEVLIPLGAGLFAKGKYSGGDIVMNAGSGVCVEKSISESIESVDRQKSEMEKAVFSTEYEMRALLGRIQQMQAEK